MFADSVVFVPEDIPDRADLLPWLIRHQVNGHVAEFDGGFGDALQAALDRVIRLPVLLKRIRSIPTV